MVHAGLDDASCDLNNVLRKLSTANRILGHKLQQRRIAKVISSFENHVLPRQFRILRQISAQPGDVARIKQFHRPAKSRVFNAFVMRQLQLICESRFFDMPLQSWPAREAVFPGDRNLRIAQAQSGSKDFRIRGFLETRMELPDALRRSRISPRMLLEQVFRLIFQVNEAGIFWESV